MASPYQLFGTSKESEIEGVELDYGDFIIKARRAGGENKEFGRQIRKYLKKHKKAVALDAELTDQQRKELINVYVDTVIVGWKNVVDANGKKMTFSKANATTLLTDLPDLFADIRESVTDFQNFREEAIATTVKT